MKSTLEQHAPAVHFACRHGRRGFVEPCQRLADGANRVVESAGLGVRGGQSVLVLRVAAAAENQGPRGVPHRPVAVAQRRVRMGRQDPGQVVAGLGPGGPLLQGAAQQNPRFGRPALKLSHGRQMEQRLGIVPAGVQRFGEVLGSGVDAAWLMRRAER